MFSFLGELILQVLNLAEPNKRPFERQITVNPTYTWRLEIYTKQCTKTAAGMSDRHYKCRIFCTLFTNQKWFIILTKTTKLSMFHRFEWYSSNHNQENQWKVVANLTLHELPIDLEYEQELTQILHKLIHIVLNLLKLKRHNVYRK